MGLADSPAHAAIVAMTLMILLGATLFLGWIGGVFTMLAWNSTPGRRIADGLNDCWGALIAWPLVVLQALQLVGRQRRRRRWSAGDVDMQLV